jgi:ABC-2 type transport system ATP-binding protein
MTNETAITTVGLTKHYQGVRALTDLTLSVPTGSVFGFLGPNGAGKTTALKMLAGLIRPTSGTASVAGIGLDAGPAYRQRVGYLAQEPRFYGWMTGRETIQYVGSLFPRASRPDAARVQEVIDLVGIADSVDRPSKTYSGGMRQRLGIAQALVARPKVLLLDEPVSALDPIGRKEVLELMRRIKGEVTVFYSTHILDDVQRVSDHVAILDRGRLVRAQQTSELLSSFTADRMRVVLGFATDDAEPALAALAGVRSVEATEHEADTRSYLLEIDPAESAAVQRSVTRLAADNGSSVIHNSLVSEGLEDVFMRLIDSRERAT